MTFVFVIIKDTCLLVDKTIWQNHNIDETVPNGTVMNMLVKELSRKQLNQISTTFMFENMDQNSVLAILKDERTVLRRYGRGEKVFDPQQYNRSLAYILKGKATVTMQKDGQSSFPMRQLENGSFFGIAALFNRSEDYVSEITAATELKIVFFQEELVEECIRGYPEFAMNYVRFQSDRIHFLNRKINLLASTSSQNSLAGYLFNAASRFGEQFRLEVSYSQLAKNLNMGRSSLYRALDDLEERGIISRNGRNITLVNYHALKKSQ